MRYKGDLSKAVYIGTYNPAFILVNSYDDIVVNAKQYQNDLEKDDRLVKKLANVQHWYYFDEEKIFAPSKFIGYKNNHVDLYEEYTSKGMSGTDTEPILKQWFIKLERESILEQELFKELECFLNQYDKRPNKRAWIHVKHNS